MAYPASLKDSGVDAAQKSEMIDCATVSSSGFGGNGKDTGSANEPNPVTHHLLSG